MKDFRHREKKMSLEKRTVDELISYFCQQCDDMEIKEQDKLQLLGIVQSIVFICRYGKELDHE